MRSENRDEGAAAEQSRPVGRKRTSADPKSIKGVTFHCYHVGILTYVWCSEDARCTVWSPKHRFTYQAVVDGKNLGKRFRTIEGAMKAAVNAAIRKATGEA